MITVLSDKRVKARKEHSCDYCKKRITVGEHHQATVCIYDDMYTWRSCDRCKTYVNEAFSKDYFECRSTGEGLDQQMFDSYMWEYHKDIAADWWEEVENENH